jgi:hypothetical protein
MPCAAGLAAAATFLVPANFFTLLRLPKDLFARQHSKDFLCAAVRDLLASCTEFRAADRKPFVEMFPA